MWYDFRASLLSRSLVGMARTPMQLLCTNASHNGSGKISGEYEVANSRTKRKCALQPCKTSQATIFLTETENLGKNASRKILAPSRKPTWYVGRFTKSRTMWEHCPAADRPTEVATQRPGRLSGLPARSAADRGNTHAANPNVQMHDTQSLTF